MIKKDIIVITEKLSNNLITGITKKITKMLNRRCFNLVICIFPQNGIPLNKSLLSGIIAEIKLTLAFSVLIMIKLMKKICLLFSIFYFLLFLSGCASLRESAKKLWGSSVVHLERTRRQGGSIEVPLAAAVCFQKTKEIIAQSGAVIYLEDKNMRYFAAMNFKGHVDTTQAGIFFTKLDDQRTRLEVGSMSPSLRSQVSELVCEKFFRQSGESVLPLPERQKEPV